MLSMTIMNRYESQSDAPCLVPGADSSCLVAISFLVGVAWFVTMLPIEAGF
jgi:hypothetical protein